MQKAFLILCLCAGFYEAHGYWKDHQANRAAAEFLAKHPLSLNSPPTKAGFVRVMMPDGVNPNVMTVLTPCGCPMEAGVRGSELVAKLKAAGVPVVASSQVSIKFMATNAADARNMRAQLDRLSTVMQGPTPIVLYQGRAKNNPNIEDVLQEYASAK